MIFQNSSWNICVPIMMILTASFFEIFVWKKQTEDSGEDPTHANGVSG